MKRVLAQVGAITIVLGASIPHVTAATTSYVSAPKTWTVKNGDTLWKISQRTGVPMKAIEQYNRISKPNTLKIGQVIKIPRIWTVKSGDSLWKISKATGVSVQSIAKANGIKNTASVNVGTVLIIPSSSLPSTTSANKKAPSSTTSASATTTSSRTASSTMATQSTTAKSSSAVTQWVVKSGDTLWIISQQTGVSEQTLIQANHLSNPNVLTVGQVLKIPAASIASTSTSSQTTGSTTTGTTTTGTTTTGTTTTGTTTTGTTTTGTTTTGTTTSTLPIIYAWADYTSSINDAMAHSSITDIGNDNYVFNFKGSVTDGTPGSNNVTNLTNYGKSKNVNVYATVSNWDAQMGNFNATLASTVLNSSSLRATLEQNLVNIATKDGYTGIDLDIEQVKPSDQTVFTDFVDELGTQLHAIGKKLLVSIPGDTGESWYSGYNLRAIGQAADLVPVMTYDYNWAGSTAGPIAPLPWDEQVLKYVTSQIPANKVLLGIGTYGYDWYTGDNNYAKTLTLSQIDTLIQNANLTPSWDSADSVPYLKYTDSNHVTHTIYYENQASIQDKLALAKEYGVAGIAFWKAGFEDTAFWNTITQNK
ncbi:LysM peptidoglycan-binding domain-containing protein [Alicyclobacillus pomorum]|uniref:LysM peptidoglycan-binding domain-containing protein n=1 Tax=Alicyclobacillus pomorum TaxID=204470 RepID=UPI00041BA211|nr:LysM peptidoglycan-binding domain-containing protein [Alicyclobacillus pomorum]